MHFPEDGSYLALTISKANPSGKKLWGLDMSQVPRNAKRNTLNFSAYDLNQNSSSLPWLKVHNSFPRSCGVPETCHLVILLCKRQLASCKLQLPTWKSKIANCNCTAAIAIEVA